MKLDIAVFLICAIVRQTTQFGTFECKFTDATTNQLVTKELSENGVTLCQIEHLNKCDCESTTTKCSFGPDGAGHMVLYQEFPEEQAEKCDPSWCTCTSHDDYEEVLAERVGHEDHTVIPGPGEEETEIQPDEPEAEPFGEAEIEPLSEPEIEPISEPELVEEEPSEPQNDQLITSFAVPDDNSEEDNKLDP